MENNINTKFNSWLNDSPKRTLLIMGFLLLIGLLIHIWNGYLEEPKPITKEESIQMAIDTLLVEKKDDTTVFDLYKSYEDYKELQALEEEYEKMINSKEIDTARFYAIVNKLKELQ